MPLINIHLSLPIRDKYQALTLYQTANFWTSSYWKQFQMTLNRWLHPFPHNDTFWYPCKQAVWKRAISPFPTVFSTGLNNFLTFSWNFTLPSAKSFNLEESKICRLVMACVFFDRVENLWDVEEMHFTNMSSKAFCLRTFKTLALFGNVLTLLRFIKHKRVGTVKIKIRLHCLCNGTEYELHD